MDKKRLAAILAAAAAICVLWLWWFGFFTTEAELPARTQCQFDLQSMATLFNEYHAREGAYPTTEQGIAALKQHPDVHIPDDPWNSPYQYTQTDSDTFKVSSSGPDGVSGTKDDLSLTQSFGSAFVISPKPRQ